MSTAGSRVLVTGGSGFIGTNLVGELRRLGFDVRSYDRKLPANDAHNSAHLAGDILDQNATKRAVEEFQPHFLVHLAARCDLRGASPEDYPENTHGVRNVAEASGTSKSLKRIVFASSRYVHANEVQPTRDDEYSPFTAYGASKAEGERIIRESKIRTPWVIIRPTSIWGPWFDVPYKGFFQAVRRGLYIHPGTEQILKSYGYVGNVVHQILGLMTANEADVHGRVYYTADYQPIEISDMAERIRSGFGAPPVRRLPLPALRAIARAGDLLRAVGVANPPLTSFRLSNLRVPMVYDLSRTESVVGPSPFGLDEGIACTIEWMKRSEAQPTRARR